MALKSNLLKLHPQALNPKTQSHLSSSSFTSLILLNTRKKPRPFIRIHCSSSSSSSSSSTPPNSKEAAILQAKTCLSTALEKPLSSARLATSKLKRPKQPRLRLEIPVADDDSPESLAQLAFEVVGALPIKRKASPLNVLIVWPNAESEQVARKLFDSLPYRPVQHADVSSLSRAGGPSSADVAVFMAPEASQLAAVKGFSEGASPRPVVMFNPRWAFDDESELGEMSGFVGSFEVVYSFMGLEVRGLLSKRNGVIFKSLSEKWSVLVEEEDGKLKLVSTFKTRPSIAEVENVLYNLMAMNSPVTNSVKFLRGLVSNVTGNKDK